MLRFSLIYSLIDRANVIQVAHVEAAYALWRYCDASVRYIFRSKTGDRIADQLLDALRTAGDEGLDRASLFAVFSNNVTAGQLDRAVARLVDAGLATTVEQPTGGRGRPSVRTFVTEYEEKESTKEILPALDLLPLSPQSANGNRASEMEHHG